MRIFALLIAAAFATSLPAAASGTARVTGNSVGPLRIGMPVPIAKSLAPVISDRRESDGEGGQIRVLRMRIGSSAVAAEIDKGRVWRMTVRSPALRTASSLGVGSRLSELLQEPGWSGGFGEGYLFVWNKRYCGLSFELSFDPHANPATNPAWNQEGLASLPSGTTVTSMLVRGCSD